ncbi:biotin-dependent carboxyltransferase family protein [Kitasatospora sp. NPDC057692]|uniref:5-oxoprolinase subunit C family protein n=1 Tax=Kitasatospora sp. NPDC057692 TaxID=3346215 RepID=UPI0036CD9D53
MTDAVVVVRPGPLSTVQDLGRRGVAHLGVPRAGALDGPALRAANRLVGNEPGAAAVETTVGGIAVRALRPLVVAVTGAPSPVRVDGRPAAWGAPVAVAAGSVVDVGAATAGVRAYLAVAGGFAVEPVLGSRSADLLSGLGPAPLAAGDRLPVGPRPPYRPAPELVPLPAPPAELVLRLRPGPRADWFAPDTAARLARTPYRVAPASNRIALRTEGPPLTRTREGELPSEGMVLGAVQVPPDGLPVVFLADHPTTGGYPVVGVVPPADLAAAAQARPGTPVRFAVLPSRPAAG